MKQDGSIATPRARGRSTRASAGTLLDTDPPGGLAEGFFAPADERRVVSLAHLTQLAAAYLGEDDLRRVREAYRFSDSSHLGQFRTSGEPYISHPIAVAEICVGWRLDADALMAALLHDVMEDSGVTKQQMVERFGTQVAELVDGLSKLDKVEFASREQAQAESFRKMLLAMARDVRVILIKLADRLHNMRTLGPVAPAKQRRVAAETLDIYAPIANRLGLNELYRELLDLSFRFMHPYRHRTLHKAVNAARGMRREGLGKLIDAVQRALPEMGVQAEMRAREKALWAIYRKMQDKRLSFSQVMDVFGIRLVVDSLPQCYLALGALHQTFKPIPGRFKDYIAIPKVNGYQSLHTTVVGPYGTPVEFQIRTREMHRVAEAGVAAHWLYKADKESFTDLQKRTHQWLKSLLDIQHQTGDSLEFIEHVKVDLFPDAVYVFTPRSKILALPRGATPVDFAYAIHSDIGDHCVAAKVNGEAVLLRAELRSGDVVEIITAPGARPNPAWLNHVRTGRARAKIRHYLKTMEQEESLALGEKMLAQALRAEGLRPPSDDPHDEEAATLWQQLSRWAGVRHRDELLVDIGLGRKIAVIVAKRLAQMMAERGARPDAVTLTLGHYAADDAAHKQGVVFIDGSQDSTVRLASCCRPIPGDAITGYLGKGEGLLVHTADCRTGRRLYERDSERWMHVEWAEEPVRAFETALVIEVDNAKGALAQVASAISNAEADITRIDMGHEGGNEVAELRLLVAVRDRVHLAEVMRALRRAQPVVKVWRVKP